MRAALVAIVVMLTASGCATQSRGHVIEQVARDLEKSQVQGLERHEHRIFPSQLSVCIFLPSNTPPAQVAKEALKANLSLYGFTKVLRVCRVRILSPEYEEAFPESYNPIFTAVLMDTAVGRRVVLLQYHDGHTLFPGVSGCWEHWTIDPDRLLNEVTGAKAGGSASLPTRTLWAARIAQFRH